MFPCQDTPSVQSTYSAKISTLKDFRVIMSANLKNKFETDNQVIYEYEQRKPIPAFGIVIVARKLKIEQLGPRSSLFAEHNIEMMKKSFMIYEEMLQIANDICGCYSLAGNYNHLSLYKSFNMFLYNKIIYRAPFIDGEIKNFLIEKVKRNLLKKFQKYQDNLERLVPVNLGKISPNKYEKYVPYELGTLYLKELEERVEGPKVFELFLKTYIFVNKNETINTKDWKEDVATYFGEKNEEFRHRDIIFECKVIEVPELLVTEVEKTCDEFLKIMQNENVEEISKSLKKIISYSDIWKEEFLKRLYFLPHVTEIKIKLLSDYISDCNLDIWFRWIRFAIKNRYNPIIDDAIKYVTFFSTPNYTYLIFKDLYDWEEEREKINKEYRCFKACFSQKMQKK
ncbi:leukotriene A-4 hydrolase-like isoform X2 [Temnothorax nylanderi]